MVAVMSRRPLALAHLLPAALVAALAGRVTITLARRMEALGHTLAARRAPHHQAALARVVVVVAARRMGQMPAAS